MLGLQRARRRLNSGNSNFFIAALVFIRLFGLILILLMLSFIVPAHNEELELPATLDAIRAAASGATQSYEIIVVNDASTDATPEIASRAGAKVIPINRRQIAAARNEGGRAAQGEYLFFIDADTRINRAH